MLNSSKIIIGLKDTTGIPPNRGYYEIIYTVNEQWIGACLTELLNNRLLLQNGNLKKSSLTQFQKKKNTEAFCNYYVWGHLLDAVLLPLSLFHGLQSSVQVYSLSYHKEAVVNRILSTENSTTIWPDLANLFDPAIWLRVEQLFKSFHSLRWLAEILEVTYHTQWWEDIVFNYNWVGERKHTS